MKSLNDINRTTKEGRLLFAALAKITTESQTDKTPEEVLEQLSALADEIDVDSIEQPYTSKEKFTPGPWVVQPKEDPDYYEIIITTDCEWKWSICEVCDGIDGDIGETVEANAALIAAAPEMYALLESLSQVLYNGHSERDAIDYLAEIHDDIKNILIKARGEVNQPTGTTTQQ